MTHKLSIGEMNRLTVEEYRSVQKLPLTIVLDNVRSQNNIGSVFRTADAFRVEHIALCGICSTPPHRDIHKTALGAENSVEWSYFESAADCLRDLKSRGYTIFAVEQIDDSIKLGSDLSDRIQNLTQSADTQLDDSPADSEKIAIVLGNEIDGVQDTLLPLCDGSLEIPQFGTKHSLNVSCAAAIVIWEMFKYLKHE